MQKKKEYLLDKIVKKNYNDKLEEVLEHKNFSEHTKSLLLSMLYKIEGSYPDYEKVKQNVETKDEYIKNIISNIQNKCNIIDVINPSSPRNVELGRKTFIINEKEKSIKCYPVERKMLYAISKISKNNLIIDKNKYNILAKSISDLINIGDNINTVEPLRDFNGYSWTTITQEIESIEHNLIYQNLRILLGYKFLKRWVENREYIVDYLALFKQELKKQYGEKKAKGIEELIIELSVLLEMKFFENEKEKLIQKQKETQMQLDKIKNKEQFIVHISQKKMEISEKIKRIDTILNNKELLEKEYREINSILPLEKKIFSMRILAEQITAERQKELEKIEKLNKLLKPQNFVKYKKELEEKHKYLSVVTVKNIDDEIIKKIIDLQKVFLQCFETKIKKAETKQEILQIIYELRYYNVLTFKEDTPIYKVEELNKSIEKVEKILLKKAKEQKIINTFIKKEELENKIFKTLLELKIISLEDVYIKVTKEKNTMYIQFFDEGIFEEKIELTTEDITKEELEIKLNKKTKFFN